MSDDAEGVRGVRLEPADGDDALAQLAVCSVPEEGGGRHRLPRAVRKPLEREEVVLVAPPTSSGQLEAEDVAALALICASKERYASSAVTIIDAGDNL